MVALTAATFFYGSYDVFINGRHVSEPAVTPAAAAKLSTSTDPQALIRAADHYYWLNNGPAAGPLYARAEQLFLAKGDERDRNYARIGRLRSNAETMSFVDLSHFFDQQLQSPMLKQDKELRLWCLIAKGYTDIESDYRAAKRDWLEARRLASGLRQKQWVTRADGELGLVAFLEGNQRRAARLLGGALLSTMASGDVAGQIRFLDLLGQGFEEVNRHSEALRFFDRAIKLADRERDCGLPFMAYEGKAEALVAMGKADDANRVLDDALQKAQSQEKRGHEAAILGLLASVAEKRGDKTGAIAYLERAGRFADSVQFYRLEADVMLELARLYRDGGDSAAAEVRAAQGLVVSQRVGDRYYLPRNLTILAELKARRHRVAEANVLYERAEDVIEGMLIGVDEPYWNSSVVGAMSQTYLQHFELLAGGGNVAGAFHVLERVRGRTLAWALEDRNGFTTTETDQAASLETNVSTLQTRLMQSTSALEREQLLDQLVEDERRLGLAWTKGDTRNQRLPVQPSSLGLVQHDLNPDEVLLEYVLDDPYSYCVSISRSQAFVRVLPAGRKQIEKWAQEYIGEIRARGLGTDLAKRLYQLLLKPIPEAKNHARLVIAPDGILNLLPFEALEDQDGQYLVKSRTVSYVPSGTILDVLRRVEMPERAPKPLLAVGDVAYENQGGAGKLLTSPTSVRGRIERGLADLSGIALSDLPQTLEEVERIGGIAGPDAVVLLGKNATETAFKQEPLADFRVLHLAVHGFADTQYPERSALVLGVDPKSADDGLLQVREIIRLHLNAQLTTLSACDTGVGKFEGQEGISNLVGAFLVAGSKSVVATLWSADDISASAIMERFYQRLAQGESASSALRDAKLGMLAQYGDQLSPFYWAGFIPVGETSSPIGIKPR